MTDLPDLPGHHTSTTVQTHPVYGGTPPTNNGDTLPETGFGVGLLLALAVVAAIAGYITRKYIHP